MKKVIGSKILTRRCFSESKRSEKRKEGVEKEERITASNKERERKRGKRNELKGEKDMNRIHCLRNIFMDSTLSK